MAFQSAFTVGTCSIEVDADATKVFSGEMGFSQSANFSFDGKNYSIAVDGTGNVTLTLLSSGTNVINWNIIVTPDYDLTGDGIQVSGFVFDASFISAQGSVFSGANLPLTSLSPPAPDPLVLTGLSPTPYYISISATVGV